MKYYIATSLERASTHNIIRDALIKLGHVITYDWTIHGSVKNVSVNKLKEVGNLMLKGVKDADFVVVLLPGGKGTHTELGASLAYNKPVFLHASDAKFLQLGEDTCAFYHLKEIISMNCPLEDFAKYIDRYLIKHFLISPMYTSIN